MAIVVPKACGIAVVRNRIKRWVRESWRHLQSEVSRGSDSVWIARPSAGKAGIEILRKEMIRL
ncbi:MAG: ribonuclease P protein component, partial [Verrucomicrobia bacterium]|nr:ribonuclease P protein component [Verrucomicrobiota bacterium]